MAQNQATGRKRKLPLLTKGDTERAIMDTYLNDMVSIPNAAIRLGTSPQSIRNALLDGRIPEDAVVWIDNTYKVLLWSKVKDLNIRGYSSYRKTKQK